MSQEVQMGGESFAPYMEGWKGTDCASSNRVGGWLGMPMRS